MKHALILFALLSAGCATKPVYLDFPVSPKMATASSNNETAITWKSEIGQTYTVYFTDAGSGTAPEWKPLPQANHLPGNGEQLTIRDKAQTSGGRRYMLLTGDQKP